MVKSQEMKDFIMELNLNYKLPLKKTLSDILLTNVFNVTKERVKLELENAKYLSVTTDGWTSKPSENYLAVTVHFFKENTELKSFILECFKFGDRQTAENLAKELKNVAEKWNIENKIVAVTTDNAKYKSYNCIEWLELDFVFFALIEPSCTNCDKRNKRYTNKS